MGIVAIMAHRSRPGNGQLPFGLTREQIPMLETFVLLVSLAFARHHSLNNLRVFLC